MIAMRRVAFKESPRPAREDQAETIARLGKLYETRVTLVRRTSTAWKFAHFDLLGGLWDGRKEYEVGEPASTI